MNLIEQLGGYEKAKNHRDYLIDFGNEFNRPNKYEVNKINNVLLEYRRQHNIFEVGDYVILNVGSRVYKIDHIYKKSVWLDSGKESLDIVNIDDISGHATNAEIKAGKRRPELDSDTCSDIRNHISPLTKVIDR